MRRYLTCLACFGTLACGEHPPHAAPDGPSAASAASDAGPGLDAPLREPTDGPQACPTREANLPAAPKRNVWSEGGPYVERVLELAAPPSPSEGSALYACVAPELQQGVDCALLRSAFGYSWPEITTWVTHFVQLPSTGGLVAAAQGTIMMSSDGGQSWSQTDLTGEAGLSRLVAHPAGQRVYAFGGTWERPVFVRSDDGGERWSRIERAAPLGALAVFTDDPDHLLAVAEGKLVESRDAGVTFGVADDAAGWWPTLAVLADGTAFASSTQGVFRRPPGQSLWAPIPDLPWVGSVGPLDWLRAEGGKVFRTARDRQQLLESGDAGRTWRVLFGTAGEAILSVAHRPGEVDVGTDRGLWKSTDQGQTWSRARIRAFAADVTALATAGSRVVAGTRGQGVHALDDAPDWAMVGRLDATVNRLGHQPATNLLFAATEDGLWRYDPVGGYWHPAAFAGMAVSALAASGAELHVAIGDQVLTSADQGDTWIGVAASVNLGEVLDLAVPQAMPTIAYAATRTGVFRSDDSGVTWSALDVPGRAPFWAVLPATPDGRLVFVGGARGIVRSEDGGRCWQRVLSSEAIGTLAVGPDEPEHVIAGGLDGFYETFDGGRTWRLDELIFPTTLHIDAAGTVLAGTRRGVEIRRTATPLHSL